MKITTLLLTMLFSSVGLAGEKTSCYKVEGMTCAACSLTIKTAAKKVDGVLSVDVNSNTNSATVVFEDQKTSTIKIASAITKAGYKASEKNCTN